MDDLGQQVTYPALAEGTAVYSSDEERLGTIARVQAAEHEDALDGFIVVDTYRCQYVKAEQIEAIYERGVVLNLDADACEDLPHPGM